MSSLVEGIITIGLAIIGLAVASVLVAPKAQTATDVQAVGAAFDNSIGVAESPVSGANVSLSLGYPSSNSLEYGFGS